MRILIVRHGDPNYDLDCLTEQGVDEAECAAEYLKEIPCVGYYYSPLGRAKETAMHTLAKVGKEGVMHPWMREFKAPICRPDLNGGRAPITWDWLPTDWMADERHFGKDTWYTTEIMQEGHVKEEYDRVCGELDKLIASHGYERCGNLYKAVKPNNDTIMLFCHFGVECVFLSHLLGISPMILWHGTCARTSSVTEIVTEERREGIASWRMLAFGETTHLYVMNRKPGFHARFCECYMNKEERHD